MIIVNNILRLLVLGWLLLILPTALRSQPYLNLDAGVAIPAKQDVRNLFPAQLGPVEAGTRIDFDPGFRIGVAGGYNFSRYFGAELETGFIYNEVRRVSPMDISISHVPLLANLIVRYDDPNVPWMAYAGGGAGGDVGILYAKVPDSLTGFGDVNDTETDLRFAWQALAGIRYKFSERISVGLGYKYYWTDVGSWDFSAAGQTFKDAVQLGHSKIHSVLLEFNIKF